MTVSTSIASKTYDGDNVTVNFPTEFAFFTVADIEVIERVVATGVETTKALTTDYTVTGGNGSTGTVIAVSAPLNTVTWTIRRAVTETQETALPVAGSLPSSAVELMVDKVVMMIQQHSEEIARSLLLPKSSSLSGLTIPNPAANNLLGWNAGATDLENKLITDSATTVTTAFAASLLNDSDPFEARTTLEAQKQDADLDAIAALSPSEGDTLVFQSGSWTSGSVSIAKDLRLAFLRIAENAGDRLNMVDGVADPFADESDVDTGSSTAGYNASGDFYGVETLINASGKTYGAMSKSW